MLSGAGDRQPPAPRARCLRTGVETTWGTAGSKPQRWKSGLQRCQEASCRASCNGREGGCCGRRLHRPPAAEQSPPSCRACRERGARPLSLPRDVTLCGRDQATEPSLTVVEGNLGQRCCNMPLSCGWERGVFHRFLALPKLTLARAPTPLPWLRLPMFSTRVLAR